MSMPQTPGLTAAMRRQLREREEDQRGLTRGPDGADGEKPGGDVGSLRTWTGYHANGRLSIIITGAGKGCWRSRGGSCRRGRSDGRTVLGDSVRRARRDTGTVWQP